MHPVRSHPAPRRGARTLAHVLCAALLASVAPGLTACTEDTLYPEEGVEGPGFTLVPHVVSVSSTIPQRMELDDTARVAITARLREGSTATLAQIGGTVLVMGPAGRDTAAFSLGPRSVSGGAPTASFALTLDTLLQRGVVSPLALPDTLLLEVHAYALTDSGSCAAAVESREQQLPCMEVDGRRLARLDTVRPVRSGVVVVSGRTTALPAAVGSIGDMVVENGAGKVFLSNRAAHRVEVFDIRSRSFGAPIPVGSQPWGLALGRTGDTLIVANSGGINVSFIPTRNLPAGEDLAKRFEIPRITLYEVPFREDSVTRKVTYGDILFYNYADRPQFVAQDAQGRLLYSAISTRAAPVGTIRLATREPGWSTWDAQLLFHNRAVFSDSSSYAIANADDVTPFVEGVAVITDHVPGMVPRTSVSSPLLPIPQAADSLNARCLALYGRSCDVWVRKGKWRLPEGVELSDTTFVAASGNHAWVAFGEGVRTPAGRIILWDAARGALSRVEDVADIVNNTSDRVLGVDLNLDGSLGTARGADATYFFGNDLRLQGLSRPAGGTGIALLPGSTGARTLAFAGTGSGTVQVLETTHYEVVGEVHVRESVVGPFRVAAPLENACPTDLESVPADSACVIATAYGLTASGGVVVVDVRRRDVRRLP